MSLTPFLERCRQARAKAKARQHAIDEEKVKRIARYVYARTGISPLRIQSQSRKPEIVFARQIVCYLSAYWEVASLARIGKVLGGRNHACIIHSKDVINELINDLDSSVEWVAQAAAVGYNALLAKPEPVEE